MSYIFSSPPSNAKLLANHEAALIKEKNEMLQEKYLALQDVEHFLKQIPHPPIYLLLTLAKLNGRIFPVDKRVFIKRKKCETDLVLSDSIRIANGHTYTREEYEEVLARRKANNVKSRKKWDANQKLKRKTAHNSEYHTYTGIYDKELPA